MKTTVVTGNLGFIGKYLWHRLQKRGDNLIGIDIADGKDIRTCELPEADEAFHLAADTDARSTDVARSLDINVNGTSRVLEKYGSKAVFVSSSAISDPTTPYAIGKLAGELLARMYKATTVRLCNIYGNGDGHGVVDIFKREDVLTINGDGRQIRTYASVDKAVQLIMNASGTGETYVLGGEDWTVNEIADRHPHKTRRYATKSPFDVMDGRQK